MNSMAHIGLALTLVLSLAIQASAAIIYVDANPNTNGTDGNTTINGVLVDTSTGGNATTHGSTGNLGDAKWHIRTRATVNEDEVWEGDQGTGSTIPEDLVTSLSLTTGTYQLYGLFWNNSNGTGQFDAAFRVGDSGNFTTYTAANSTIASTTGDEFQNLVNTRDGGQWLMIADLGQHVVTNSIDVYVRTPDSSVTGEQRTWYDGVGYQLVPEPGSLALGTGIIGLLLGFFRTLRTDSFC